VGDGHPSGMPVARHLVRSDPGRGTSDPWTLARPSLFDLAPGGVYRAGRSPGRRWALTPPFHRCRGHEDRGCVLSVALSFGSPRLDVIQRPALWSPDFPQAENRPRPSDRLAGRVYRRRGRRTGREAARRARRPRRERSDRSARAPLQQIGRDVRKRTSVRLTRARRRGTMAPLVVKSGEKWCSVP